MKVAYDGGKLPPVDTCFKFDGKNTSWRVRANTKDGRYTICTAAIFGTVYYSIIDWQESVRGAMNVIGQGLGIFTTKGKDDGVNEAIAMLEDKHGGWEISRRNNVPLKITGISTRQVKESAQQPVQERVEPFYKQPGQPRQIGSRTTPTGIRS